MRLYIGHQCLNTHKYIDVPPLPRLPINLGRSSPQYRGLVGPIRLSDGRGRWYKEEIQTVELRIQYSEFRYPDTSKLSCNTAF